MLAKETLSLKEWISVLKLATMWQMDNVVKKVKQKIETIDVKKEVWMDMLDVPDQYWLPDARALAIKQLSNDRKFRGVDKILLAKKHKIESWLRDGIRQLVYRKEHFEDEEADQLGWKTVNKLYRVREACHANGFRDPRTDINIVLEREFGAEFMEMKASTETQIDFGSA